MIVLVEVLPGAADAFDVVMWDGMGRKLTVGSHATAPDANAQAIVVRDMVRIPEGVRIGAFASRIRLHQEGWPDEAA